MEITEAQKKEALREIQKYAKSAEFEKLAKYCNSKGDEYLEKIVEELKSKDRPILFSEIDKHAVYIEVLKDIAPRVTSKVYKVFLENRILACSSYMTNKIGADTKIYSSLDITKFHRQEYVCAVDGTLMAFCIANYQNEQKKDENMSAY